MDEKYLLFVRLHIDNPNHQSCTGGSGRDTGATDNQNDTELVERIDMKKVMRNNRKHNGWIIQRPIHTKVTSGLVYREPDFTKHGGILSIVLVDPERYTPECPWDIVLGIVHTKKAQFRETVYTHEAVFYSESRRCRWKKGEKESGNILLLREIHINCYGDSLMYIVKQTKPEVGFCHTGAPTCFSSIITGVFERKGNTTLTIIPL